MRAAIGVWVVVVVVTVVASGYLEGCFAAPTTERPPAASFDLVRLDGVPVRLADQAGQADSPWPRVRGAPGLRTILHT